MLEIVHGMENFLNLRLIRDGSHGLSKEVNSMKVQTHEIAMQSKHVEYKSMIESKLSFSSFFTDTPMEDFEQLQKAPKPEAIHTDCSSYFSEQSRTLEGIIQNLIRMIQAQVGSADKNEESEQEVFGYTHYSMSQMYEETESLSFSTMGHVVTDTGSIDLNLNFSMTRSFMLENRIDIYTAFDPLVINLDGDIPNLLSDTFSFDLDNDGTSDQISKLGSGSGFLALDKNKDGEVNRGSELFGTITGDGFGELREYDEDKNSWIDENDSIFDSLQIWLKNEDKNEKELISLGEVGIGAIYLNSESSGFTYKTPANNVLGEMKSSGIFLHEDGKVGNISQIDFVASSEEKEEPLATFLQA